MISTTHKSPTTDFFEKKMNDIETSEIKKLKDKINEQNIIILKQQKKLKHLSRSNEYFRHSEYVKFKNQSALEDMIQNLEIFINFFDVDQVEYRIYGDFFEKLMIDKPVANSTINIYVNYTRLERFDSLTNIFFSLKKISNRDDYNLLRYYINEQGIKINYFHLAFIVDGSSIIHVNLHDVTNIHNYTATTQNFCITENGIESIYKNGNKNLYSTKDNLDVFFNLYLLKNKKTNLVFDKNNKKIIDNPNLLKTLSSQQYYEKNNLDIINKFPYSIQDCPVCLENNKCFELSCNHSFCLDCLIHHIDNSNYENKNCPLCRAEMNLK